MSTWLPGKKAVAPSRSTVKPPFTLPNITPLTLFCSSRAFSKLIHDSSLFAFSRLKTACPFISSNLSI